NQAVLDLNQHLIFGYQFIRSFLLYLYHRHSTLPAIDYNFVLNALKTIGVTDRKRPNKKKYLTLVELVNKQKKRKKKRKKEQKIKPTSSSNPATKNKFDITTINSQIAYLHKQLFPKQRRNLLRIFFCPKKSLKIIRKRSHYKCKSLYKYRISQLSLIDKLNQHFISHFKYSLPFLPNYSNKLYILKPLAFQMATCINTNLSSHFLDYLYRYVKIG